MIRITIRIIVYWRTGMSALRYSSSLSSPSLCASLLPPPARRRADALVLPTPPQGRSDGKSKSCPSCLSMFNSFSLPIPFPSPIGRGWRVAPGEGCPCLSRAIIRGLSSTVLGQNPTLRVFFLQQIVRLGNIGDPHLFGIILDPGISSGWPRCPKYPLRSVRKRSQNENMPGYFP